MGLYASLDRVKQRLLGKVRFTKDDQEEDKLLESTAEIWISEAEGELEQCLAERYATPFQGWEGQPFSQLPPRPTRNWLRNAAEMLSCVYILENDFGRGTAVDGDKYAESLRKRFDKMIENHLEKRAVGSGWKSPPLNLLRLAPWNQEADDGFQGMILKTGSEDENYAANQINRPGESWWFGLENEREWDYND